MKKRHHSEAGFVLLFVYAMAAAIAIMLFMATPRAAFEAQRDKEQLLIDRGEAYSRGIQLYVRKFNRYPADFQALDNTGNQRFIRHRYVDPMSADHTEKDEWRIIHVGPGGVFTDSLLYTKKKDPKAEQQTFITELAPVGGAQVDASGQLNLANRRRPSDQAGGVPGAPVVVDPNNPGAVFSPPGVEVAPGGQPPPGFPVPPGIQFPPGVQPPPGVLIPGVNGQPGANGAPSAAVNLINNLLTSPRPGGFPGQQQPATLDQFGNPMPAPGVPGIPNGQQPGFGRGLPQANGAQPNAGQPNQAQAIGGGIAGVASKIEREGIKLYRDHKSYHEWEFVYDLAQDKSRAGGGQITPVAAPGGAPGGAPGTPPPPPPPPPLQPQR